MTFSNFTGKLENLLKSFRSVSDTDTDFNMITKTHTPQVPLSSHPYEASQDSRTASHSGLDGVEASKVPSLSNEVLKQQKSRKLSSEILSNFINGFAGGLVLPCALTAGLSSVVGRKAIIAAGILELIAGAFSISGRALLAACQEREEFIAEEKREVERIHSEPDEVCEDVVELFCGFEVEKQALQPMLESLARRPEQYLRFMMEFKHQMQRSSWIRVFLAAATIVMAYLIAGVIPMIPYFAMTDIAISRSISLSVASIQLLLLGFWNGYQATGTKRSGLRVAAMTLVVGAITVGSAFAVGEVVNKLVNYI